MGYTHYFQQKKEISDDAWGKICKDTKVIISSLKKSKIKLTSNHPSKVMVDEIAGYINFNGVGDEEYETFAISKEFDSQFNFCKTAQNPYDLAVTATLMIVEHHAPNHFAISSDGEVEDWKDAAELNRKLFGYGFIFPIEIANSNQEYAKEIETEMQEEQNKNTKKKKNPYSI